MVEPVETLTLLGLDTQAGQHWTWRWGSGPWVAPHRLDRVASLEVGWLLASAIPGLASTSSPVRGGPDPLGAFANAEGEWNWSRRLGELLLPPGLRAELAERAASGRLRVRVLPSRATATVPWELLPVGAASVPERRLLDVADVEQVAPPVVRSPRASVPGSPPLLLVDPDVTSEGLGRVLTLAALRQWRADGGGGGSVFGHRVDRRWLARMLPGRSRFVFVGHVAAAEDPWETGLVLGCRRSTYGTGRAWGVGLRPFTARDLAWGTRGITAVMGDAAVCAQRFGVRSLGAEAAPSQAWDETRGVPVEVAGADLWPMPPRVGLVGCRSGPDLAHSEPVGLVTGVLAAGAEIVIATRWTLYTARTIAAWGGEDDAVAVAARAVDSALAEKNPTAALASWQRAQLNAWRTHDALEHSPVTWAALCTTT